MLNRGQNRVQLSDSDLSRRLRELVVSGLLTVGAPPPSSLGMVASREYLFFYRAVSCIVISAIANAAATSVRTGLRVVSRLAANRAAINIGAIS